MFGSSRVRPRNVLVLPGLGGSGARHWQTLWEARHGYRRVEQASWTEPRRDDWVASLDGAIRAAGGAPVTLVAHSLACAAVAHWAAAHAADTAAVVAGALLVAPADVDSPVRTPPETRSFAPLPLAPLPFSAIVVASETDPFIAFDRARLLADRWGATFVGVGAAGHINADSGLADWPEGHRLLEPLLARVPTG